MWGDGEKRSLTQVRREPIYLVSSNTRTNPMTYLTTKRTQSLKQYLADCAAGMDTVAAWNAHKARMAA
jgi:hypothetical protein